MKNVRFMVSTVISEATACLTYTQVSLEANISRDEKGIEMRMLISLFSNREWQSRVVPVIIKAIINAK